VKGVLENNFTGYSGSTWPQVYLNHLLGEEHGGSKFQGLLQLLANPITWSINPYQPGRPISDVKREFGLEAVTKLASNENPAGPSPLALEALQSLLPQINFYPDDNDLELKEALAEKFNVERENLILGHGATDILEIIVRAFVCPGDEVISAHPSFPWFQILGQMSGAINIVVPLRDDRHDLPAMAAKITSNTKVVFIANPNNPTGTIVDRDEICSFLRSVPDHVVVVMDEAYIEYVTRKEIDSLAYISQKPVIVVRTFSKIAGLAGLRIGFAVAEREIIRLLERVKQPFNTTALAHAAALASLQDREHLERSRQMVTEGKQYLYPQFERLGVDYVRSEANFVFVDFHQDSHTIADALLRQGFIIRPMLDSCARITVGAPEQNAAFVTALAEVLSEESL